MISHTPFSRCTKPCDTQFRLLISLRLIRAIQIIFVALVSLFLSTAKAASLGEAELRSWLGEPLNIRIPVITTATEAELLDRTCLRITADSEPFSLVRELRVEIPAAGERNEERHFMLRGFQSVNEPYIKLVVRFACVGQGAISREYTLLLDPRPSVNAPATERNDAIATSNKNIEPVPIQQRLSGQWVTPPSSDNNRADSLANIAEGVYPKSVKRKARYIAALRALNPTLAGLDDNAKLPPNTALTLPDLRTLSTTRKVVAAKPASAPSASTPPAIRPSANTKPATSSK